MIGRFSVNCHHVVTTGPHTSIVSHYPLLSETCRKREIVFRRYMSAQPRVNHYSSLGLTSKATQGEIKTAYYKLSKIYHPDLNKNSEEASGKFREISAAYEVLGNIKLRKMYDKGLLTTHIAHDRGSNQPDIDVEIEKMKFYRSRQARSKAPDASGRTPIYDFDEWSRAHYGHSFTRRAEAKARHAKEASFRTNNSKHAQTELLIFGVVVLGILLWWENASSQSKLDTPKPKG